MKTHSAQVIRYGGRESIPGIPTRNGLTTILQQNLSNNQPIYFISNDVSDATEYVKNVSTYILRIYGTLINGENIRKFYKAETCEKFAQVSEGIKPFFDILVPDNKPLSIFKSRLVKIISGAKKINKSKFGVKNINAHPIQVRKYGIETASDDITNIYYYRKIACKKKLPLSEWAILNDYHCIFDTNLPYYSYSFRVSVNNYQSLEDNKSNDLIISKVLSYDRTLVLAWDIETYSGRKMGNLPDARNEEDQVFMICMTVHWKDNPNLLLQISPDIQIKFNDSQYDWSFIIEKVKKIIKWKYRRSEIKINDEKFYSKYLKIPGCIPIDVRACFKKLYQKSEASSLKYYLEKCGLGNKADMPITTMNKIYEDAILHSSNTSAKNMCKVANYCVIDARRCQELIVKHNVINDYREVSSIAYVSLSDSHYFAGENTESGKYPGAYIITPIKGLKNKRLVTDLDFASLYPKAKNILRDEKKLHKIEFLFNSQTIEAWSIRHNNIPEEKGLYARVLENLFDKRKKMKECLNELDEKSFEYSCLDSKQKGVKLYINTFYSEAGNNLSPFYQLQLAGEVTFAGRHNIKFVRKFVEDKGFGVKYGDTDSLYLTCPEECF
ncbi:hypothetical protein Glove_199g123 [Diversispora epigaea]|uniref:DNA polymerase n=1 Tax=Diversispora epigaea TaxID=1348612 RepID=A0A397IT29_9GLOM|nr:hypothetical protein Glove_199g123 [Diversispora epigaea]